MQVRFAELALVDLEPIRTFIAQDGLSAARRMAAAIVTAADRLSDTPRLDRSFKPVSA
jgi:plasmid stabilization system protein ParE